MRVKPTSISALIIDIRAGLVEAAISTAYPEVWAPSDLPPTAALCASQRYPEVILKGIFASSLA